MPELPEVETVKRELGQKLVGKTIKNVSSTWPKMLRPLTLRQFQTRLKGQKIKAVGRRAKVLVWELTGRHFLLTHLKMTGQLIFVPKIGGLVVGGHPQPNGLDDLPNRYTRIIFDFTDGSHLYFNDLRKFGWMKLVSQTEKEQLFMRIGVEPLTQAFTLKKFQALLKRYPKRKLKQVLLDQSLIAGIGNIYADEACFRAKVLPARLTGSLKPKEVTALYQAIKYILKLSISKKGTSARNYRRSDGSQGEFVRYLKVYGRSKKECQRCQNLISKVKQNGRGTHFCSRCQY